MIFSDYIHSCSIDCCHTGVALWVTCWVHGLFCCSNVSTLTSYYPLWVSGPFIWWPRAGPLWGRVWAACGPWATVWIAKLKSVSRGTFTGSERYKNRHLHFIICQINEGQKRGRGQISIGPSILVPGPLTSWKRRGKPGHRYWDFNASPSGSLIPFPPVFASFLLHSSRAAIFTVMKVKWKKINKGKKLSKGQKSSVWLIQPPAIVPSVRETCHLEQSLFYLWLFFGFFALCDIFQIYF